MLRKLCVLLVLVMMVLPVSLYSVSSVSAQTDDVYGIMPLPRCGSETLWWMIFNNNEVPVDFSVQNLDADEVIGGTIFDGGTLTFDVPDLPENYTLSLFVGDLEFPYMNTHPGNPDCPEEEVAEPTYRVRATSVEQTEDVCWLVKDAFGSWSDVYVDGIRAETEVLVYGDPVWNSAIRAYEPDVEYSDLILDDDDSLDPNDYLAVNCQTRLPVAHWIEILNVSVEVAVG